MKYTAVARVRILLMPEKREVGGKHINAVKVKKAFTKMEPSLGFPFGIEITLMTMTYLRCHQSRELRMCGQQLKI